MKTFLAATEITPGTTWVKGSRSGAAGHCAELAKVDGKVALRHSKDHKRGAFLFTQEEATALIQGAKDGEFDHLLGE